MVSENSDIDETYHIFAGKLRRYHGEGLRQLLDFKTVFLNIRDMVFVLLGIVQMVWLIRKISPKKVFIKGGFVGVPVGLVAALWRIPFVTHDSDAIPGLANRIIARWASVHAVALPKKTYAYPQSKTITVGVPISSDYSELNETKIANFKKQIGIPSKGRLLFVTGGGLGARVINDSVVAICGELLKQYPDLHIAHTAGHLLALETQKSYEKALSKDALKRVTVHKYLDNLYAYSGAAEIVIARAGATNMAELAAQGKASIIIPSPVLAGGHQLKNAEIYANARAAIVLQQKDVELDPEHLLHAINVLLNDDKKRQSIGRQLQTFAYPDSAKLLAGILLNDLEVKR